MCGCLNLYSPVSLQAVCLTVDSALTSKSVFRVRPGYRIYMLGGGDTIETWREAWKGEGVLGLGRRTTSLEEQTSLKPREEMWRVLPICNLDFERLLVHILH